MGGHEGWEASWIGWSGMKIMTTMTNGWEMYEVFNGGTGCLVDLDDWMDIKKLKGWF
jgi:hypothetical protein